MGAAVYRNSKRKVTLFIHSPIDDGSGFIGVRWARHLDFGHGVTVQALSIAPLLLMMGGVVIAVAARRLLRSDAATRSATKRVIVINNKPKKSEEWNLRRKVEWIDKSFAKKKIILSVTSKNATEHFSRQGNVEFTFHGNCIPRHAFDVKCTPF